MTEDVPQHLIDQITAGRCVAFVGAGFAAPAVPAWKDLLRGLAERASLDEDTASWLGELIGKGSARDLEAAAQVLQMSLGADFDPALAEELRERGREDALKERRRLLAGIPFDAILTTNFDPFLTGQIPGPKAYKRILRDPPHRWWEPRYWEASPGTVDGAPIIKLHGEAGPQGGEVVFTQRDYRERLYSSPAYMLFLRSLFATNTVLFLGVSFTDAYLNELRSEVLAMLDHGSGDDPVAYAVLADVEPHQSRYLLMHEGLAVLSYDTKGGTDFSGFETYLRLLHDATNPKAQLGRALSGRKVLWADPDPDDTSYGSQLLTEAAESSGGTTKIVQVTNEDDAAASLRTDGADLVIADWPLAGKLLETMRNDDLRVPVIVFARGTRDVDRRAAMALGATDVLTEWGDLFKEIARVVLDPADAAT